MAERCISSFVSSVFFSSSGDERAASSDCSNCLSYVRVAIFTNCGTSALVISLKSDRSFCDARSFPCTKYA